ncbi:MAG: Dabb family protein [Planctomycetota bacterium]
MPHVTRVNSVNLGWGLGAILSTLMIAGIMSQTSAADKAGTKPEKLLRHVVLYKFKSEATPAQIQEVVDAFSALPSKINSIVGFERGTNVSEENKSEGLTHCFVVTFRDTAGRATYLKHPAHDEYVKVVKDRREKVVVFDYWTEG